MAFEGSGKLSNVSNLEIVGRFFYIMDPYKYMYEKPIHVPDYVVDALPFFTAAVLLEMLVAFLKGEYNHKMFYVFNNVAGGVVQVTFNRLVVKPMGFIAYCYIYEHYRWYELPWDSIWTWLLAFLCVDFIYYCFHRGAHEINLLWCAHQMHHSSEDFNLTTAIRQSLMQKYFDYLNLPMAMCIPPSIFLIHFQFNLLFQFWIHTEVVPKLGPLEYIFNTASHHRVHHGRNPYCIDTNYGGTLIIWDRLFGTFAEENEKVTYGLVHAATTANPLILQTEHFYNLFRRFWRLEKWSDKLGCVFQGPGWLAECEKVGLKPEDMVLPEVEQPPMQREMEYFHMEDRFETRYVLFHFIISVFVFTVFFAKRLSLSVWAVYICLSYLFGTLTSCGFILEGRWFWHHVEAIRCTFCICLDVYLMVNSIQNPILPSYVEHTVRIVTILSLLVTSFHVLFADNEEVKQKKKK